NLRRCTPTTDFLLTCSRATAKVRPLLVVRKETEQAAGPKFPSSPNRLTEEGKGTHGGFLRDSRRNRGEKAMYKQVAWCLFCVGSLVLVGCNNGPPRAAATGRPTGG